MHQLSQILLVVLPVFCVIGLGFILKRTSLVTDEFIFQLNKLIYYVALPALLFYKIGSSDFHRSFDAYLLLCLLGSMILVCFSSYLLGRVLRIPDFRLGAFSQGAFRSNAAYIGIAVVFNAYGEEGLAIGGIVLGFFVPLLNVLSVIVLMLPMSSKKANISPAMLLGQVLYNPLIIASFTGVLWSLAGIPMVPVLDKSLSIVTGMSLPLALVSIGASFSFGKFKGDIKLVSLATVIKIILMPLFTVWLLWSFGVRGTELGIGFIIAGAPTAAAAFVMAQQMESDAELTGSIIMVSTLLSLVTYTVGLYILSTLGG